MSKNDKKIGMVQAILITEMKRSKVTMQIASEYLGYANRSSVTRSLAKPNMSVLDIIKIMALCPISNIEIPGLYIHLNIRTTDDVLKMKVCQELFEEFRHSVFQDGYYRKFLYNCTWNEVTIEDGNYNDPESTRKSWIQFATPLHLVMTVLKVTALEEITVSTKSGDTLTIGIKQKKAAAPLSDDLKFFPN